MEVLKTEEDFYELAMAYFKKAEEMGVRYAEVMVDVQRHTKRGVGVEVMIGAMTRARVDADKGLNVRVHV